MPKNCSHSEYRMSPEFTTPIFERKHVQFSVILDFYAEGIPFLYSFHGWGCKDRIQEVADTMSCMKYLYPAPTAWNAHTEVKSLDEKTILHDYCVTTGKVFITYTRPDRRVQEYKPILKDICEGLAIVNSYKVLSKNPHYNDKPIYYTEMKKQHNEECSDNKWYLEDKPSFCYAEYQYDYKEQCVAFQLDCASGALKKAVSQKTCNETEVMPEYVLDQGSISYHRAFAYFSFLSYNDQVQSSEVNWLYLGHSTNNKWGFYGHAFTNRDLQITVVVYRGTDDVSIDWLGSNFAFGLGYEPFQYRYALEYFDHVRSMQDGHYQYFVTGHSLGGGLAQLVSIARNIPAVTFDAPGVMIPAKNLFTQTDINKASHHITSYIFGLNLVNCAGRHIVDPIKVREKLIEDCNKNFLKYTLAQHDIRRGYEMFHSISGKPLYEEKIAKESLNIQYARKQISQQCQKEDFTIIRDMFECADIILRNNDHSKKGEIFVPVSNNKIIVTQYFSMLKPTSLCKGIISTSNTNENIYQMFLEDADKRKSFIDTAQQIIKDQIKYDFPFPVKLDCQDWVEDNENNLPALEIYKLNCTVDIVQDRCYYLNKLKRDQTLQTKYNVIVEELQLDKLSGECNGGSGSDEF